MSTKDELRERLAAEYPGYHPVIAMARMAHRTQNIALQFACHKEIARYIEPQLKAVEVKGSIDVGTGVMRIPSGVSGEEWSKQAQALPQKMNTVIESISQEIVDEAE